MLPYYSTTQHPIHTFNRMKRITWVFAIIACFAIATEVSKVYGMSISHILEQGGTGRVTCDMGRRKYLSIIGTVMPPVIQTFILEDTFAIETPSSKTLSSRMTSEILYQPKIKQMNEMNLFTSSNGLYDDLFYPLWMSGEWDVYQTLTNFQAPLGKKFLSGPSGLRPDVADATINQQQSLIGKTVGPIRLRFVMVDLKEKKILSSSDSSNNSVVVEDRLNNLRTRANAFAGKDIVKTIEYVEIGGANALNYGEAPLPTTLLRYKGPGIQKTFSNNRESEIENVEGEVWTGFESTRTIFARKDIDLPPVVSDTEAITQLKKPLVDDLSSNGKDVVVLGKLRLAGYLNPNDALYFEARQRAVTLSDYDLKFVKVTSA